MSVTAQLSWNLGGSMRTVNSKQLVLQGTLKLLAVTINCPLEGA
jgi:hypothetical protein